MTEGAKPTVLIDDERTRVTERRFAPGAATGWHRHEHDYIVVPLAGERSAAPRAAPLIGACMPCLQMTHFIEVPTHPRPRIAAVCPETPLAWEQTAPRPSN